MATGLANVSATFAGVLSGFLAHSMGFKAFFGFTFLATFPGLALIFFLPYLDGPGAADRAESTSDTPGG
jgi:MFS transporter, PAT family, beta-lactamase induction signal transducer AmpG